MRVVSVWYNSSGYLDIVHRDNATDKRLLEVLRKAVRQMEKRVNIKVEVREVDAFGDRRQEKIPKTFLV